MSNTFFTPNWHAINKAVNGSPDDRKLLRQAIDEFSTKVKNKVREKLAQDEQDKKLAHIKALKEMPNDTVLYYIGYDPTLFMCSGEKYKTGRKYIGVKFGKQYWSIPFDKLQIMPPDTAQIESLRLNMRIRTNLSEIINRIPFGKE